MFGVLAPEEETESEQSLRFPAFLTTAWRPIRPRRPEWLEIPKKKRIFCHTMKLYNVNIYKEITFICGYYGENDLVNKVLVMFAHF